MNRVTKGKKLYVELSTCPADEIRDRDVGKIEKEDESKDKNNKQLVVTRSEARWLRIGESIGQWLQSLVGNKK